MNAKHVFLFGLICAIWGLSAPTILVAQDQSTEPAITEQPATSEQNEILKEKPLEAENTDEAQEATTEEPINDVEIPEVSYDLAALPFPTRRMRELLLEAAREGDIEKLRQLIGIGDNATQLSFGGTDGDPIEFLKQESGDDAGHEILAILSEVLEAGYVHLDVGTENELFVWPYFFALPIDGLNSAQKVELFRIVTYGDFQDMQEFGGYIFYRVGISPTGRWEFFVAGD